MKLTDFAIKQVAELTKDELVGSKWVDFFNSFGARDIYDDLGLPDISKKNKQRPSKKEYIFKRLYDFNNTHKLQEIILRVASLRDGLCKSINDIIIPEKYKIEIVDGQYIMMGDVHETNHTIETEAHFQDIQSKILLELSKARVSIIVAVAWFTNQTLANKLIEKYQEGLNIKVLLYDDYTNRTHHADFSSITVKMTKAIRGGKMHDKFCVIDNQVVVTGSYNWSNSAEFRNDENIAILRDNQRASDFSVEFRRLWANK